MNIPTDIPSRINPDIQDPVSKSVIYSFTDKDALAHKQGYLTYMFPYSKDTYWTNFKYSCYNMATNQPVKLEIGIGLDTSDGYNYCVQMIHEREDKVWYDTEWPFPSINVIGMRHAGLYFKVKMPSDGAEYKVNISLLGFMDLLPKTQNYLLLSPLDTYQFVFSKFELDEEGRGSIYNVENEDYIRGQQKKSCGVRMIKRY